MENSNETLADRIRHRLEVVGKSAAAVSLEAGLGRSAVQDILSGNSSSPRLDTIQKLTGPLQCSLNYLVSGSQGGADHPPVERPFRDLSLMPAVRDLETGVFRAQVPLKHQTFERNLEWAISKAVDEEEFPTATDLRLPNFTVYPSRLMDRSLELLGIYKGDILLAAGGFGDHYELRHGQIVIVRRTIHPQNLDEWTARFVEPTDAGFRLAAKSNDPIYGSYEIPPATSFGSENTYSIEDGWISIEAIVTGIYRKMQVV